MPIPATAGKKNKKNFLRRKQWATARKTALAFFDFLLILKTIVIFIAGYGIGRGLQKTHNDTPYKKTT